METRNIYIENLRNAAASDTYTLRGDRANETYEPRYEMYTTNSFVFPFLFCSVSLSMVFVI